MRILAIPASNSTTSINRKLLACVAKTIKANAADTEIEFADLNNYETHIYSPEREAQTGIPNKAQELFDLIGNFDAIIISFAEHNGSYTAAWKNIFDWMSRIDANVYQNKPVAMFSASPGPRAGAAVLGTATSTAPFFGADLVGSLGVGSFEENFDSDNEQLTNPELNDKLNQILKQLLPL